MSEADEPDPRSLWNALRQLGQRPNLLERLRSNETSADAMKELRLHGDSARRAVLDVVNDLELKLRSGVEPPPIEDGEGVRSNDAARPRGGRGEPAPDTDVEGVRAFFTDAFRQLQRAYRISMGMSVTMFLIGLVFLGIAALKSVLHPEQVAATSVVGGIGILQIVALFYRNPLADIARSLAQAQQAKVALTSYLIGITMLHDSVGPHQSWTERHVRVLLDLTSRAIEHLRAPSSASEPRASGARRTSRKPPA